MLGVRPAAKHLECTLQKCRDEKILSCFLHSYQYLQCDGFKSHPSLQRALLCTFTDFGSRHCAHHRFERIAHSHHSCMGNPHINSDTNYGINSDTNYGINRYTKCDINGYTVCSQPDLALAQKSVCVSGYTVVDLLKVCIELKNVGKGLLIHADIIRKGFLDRNPFIGCTLINMYMKCGSLESAERVFKYLPKRDIVLWTTLVTGYVDYGFNDEALISFEAMQSEGIVPDAFMYVCIFKACSKLRNLDEGRNMYARVVKNGLLEKDVFLKSALVDMLVKCGALEEAQYVFDKQQPISCNVITWTALITGYVEHQRCEEALFHMEKMQNKGILPTPVTFICGLISCGILRAVDRAYEKHVEIIKRGLERDMVIGNTLVDMYAKCGSLAEGREVFDKLVMRNVVSFNVIIGAYVEQGHGEEALQHLENMHCEHISPNATTLTCSLKACGSIGARDRGQKLHSYIITKGLLESDELLGNSLVDMYIKTKLLEEAQEVFDRLLIHDVISWTMLITGYSEYGDESKALHCFQQMQEAGISPVEATFVSGLTACGNLGAIGKGQYMHGEVMKKGLEEEVVIGNTMVSMYAKCGLLGTAKYVFDRLLCRDIVSCNALMTGYGHLGESLSVLNIFQKMKQEGIEPDATSFVCIINAYSHGGLLGKGQMYFTIISKYYGFAPTLDHYNCVVDLIARAGHMYSAMAIIKKMPLHPGIMIWHSLLGACRKWGNVALGRYAFDEAVQLDEGDDAAYLCMFNIYSDADMDDEAKYIERLRVEVMNR